MGQIWRAPLLRHPFKVSRDRLFRVQEHFRFENIRFLCEG